MGRQIQLEATHVDCWDLIDFIATLTPVRVFGSFARTQDELWTMNRETPLEEFTLFHVWPTRFPWTPEYGITGGERCDPSRAGLHYVRNNSTAPLIEISGSIFENGHDGRIYWNKGFAPPHASAEDTGEFSKLVDALFRHARRIGKKDPDSGYPLWVLPDALHRREAE